jgi:hypothetical protein
VQSASVRRHRLSFLECVWKPLLTESRALLTAAKGTNTSLT